MLHKLIVESMKETPEIYNLLLVDRNRKWVLQIEDYLVDEEDYLVVVGGGHSVGEGRFSKVCKLWKTSS